MSNGDIPGFEDMLRRMKLINIPSYKDDMDKLASQITKFLDKYDLQGLMGFYKGEQFKFSILFDENAVNSNIFNP